MTIEFSETAHDWIMKIVYEDGHELYHKREYSRYLTELYLKYVETHELANGCSYEHNLNKWLHCGKCQKRVWDWFRKYYKQQGGVEQQNDD